MADGVFFPGLNIVSAEMSLVRGISPSICSAVVVPYDGMNLPPDTLTFLFNGNLWQFNNCAVVGAPMRRRIVRDGQYRWLWSVQIADRRWKWKFGSISGTYNQRIPNTATLTSAQQLMSLCLTAMGESNFDVSGAPTNVYPFVQWNGNNPAQELAKLCDYCACEVVLGLDDKVTIWPLGVGGTLPTASGEMYPKFRYTPRTVPSSIQVRGGESLYQYRLLLEAIGRGTNLVQSVNPDWLSGITIGVESLNFPDVTNTVGSELAMATGWRQFRVKSQEGGGLNVPGVSVSINNTSQYQLKNYILYTAYDDRTQKYQTLPYYVEGDFWPYSDLPNNTSNTVYLGPSTIYPDRLLVEFQYPVIAFDTSGLIKAPTLYLQAAYGVKDPNGESVRIVRNLTLGGTGGQLTLNRPEVFAGYAATGNTEGAAFTEADAYLTLFQRKFNSPLACSMEYAGVRPVALDGNIAQVVWRHQFGRAGSTFASEFDELDTITPSRAERRRREQGPQ